MCLITKQQKSIVLKEDLIVYKTLVRTSEENTFCSVLHNFWYRLGELNKTKIKVEKSHPRYNDSIVGDFYTDLGDVIRNSSSSKSKLKQLRLHGYKVIGEGFHFYRTKTRCSFRTSESVLVQCTIPKGSKVYYDETGLGVSNQIIINKVL